MGGELAPLTLVPTDLSDRQIAYIGVRARCIQRGSAVGVDEAKVDCEECQLHDVDQVEGKVDSEFNFWDVVEGEEAEGGEVLLEVEELVVKEAQEARLLDVLLLSTVVLLRVKSLLHLLQRLLLVGADGVLLGACESLVGLRPLEAVQVGQIPRRDLDDGTRQYWQQGLQDDWDEAGGRGDLGSRIGVVASEETSERLL